MKFKFLIGFLIFLVSPGFQLAWGQETANNLIKNFSVYEPVYFISGFDPLDAKFQLSFKYKVFGSSEGAAKQSGLHIGFTQTSLWDLDSTSKPFKDSSYKPEILYQMDLTERFRDEKGNSNIRLIGQVGVQHESNGQGEPTSRSLNNVYLQGTATKEFGNDLFWSLSGRGIVLFGDISDNPDIRDFRGRSIVNFKMGYHKGFQLSTQLRGSLKTGKGSLLFNATLPASKLIKGFNILLHAQVFTGYGESLLDYNKKNTKFRIGIGLLR